MSGRRVGLWLSVGVGIVLAACAKPSDDRMAVVVSTLARADEPLIRARPKLIARKYGRMAESPFLFFRGNQPLYARDWDAGQVSASVFRETQPLWSPGDAHPENFGTLRGSSAFTLEHNDFDGGDLWPPLWDLRRLITGLVLFSRAANPDDVEAQNKTRGAERETALACAQGYADGLSAYAGGAPREPISSGVGSPVLADLFAKSEEDAKGVVLSELTVLSGGKRTLRRGSVEADDPLHQVKDLPSSVVSAIPAAVAYYRSSLALPPPAQAFQVLDAAREFGSGVSSLARVRILVLLAGPTGEPEDDWIVELKEMSDPVFLERRPPAASEDTGQTRVMRAARTCWSTPDADALWGTTQLLGLPIQVKPRTTGARTVRLSRLNGGRGTPQALSQLALTLGAVLARSHAGTPGFREFAKEIDANRQVFLDEQANAGVAEASAVESDWALFVSALRDLGPRLGVPEDERDKPDDVLAALFDGP